MIFADGLLGGAFYFPFLILGVGLFFVSIIQFTFETLTICSLVYLALIPVGIYNYKLKLKNVQQDEIDDQHQDIL